MAWYHRLLNVVRPTQLSRELDAEIASHIAERTDDLVAGGMSREEAGYAARRQFGNATVQKERTHDVDGMVWLESLLADTRYAARALARSPGFTIVAVLSLALGIGANTAIFSLTNAIVLRSLPVRNPDELVAVAMADETGSSFTNPLWEQIRDDSSVFSGSLAYGMSSVNLASSGDVRRANSSWVSGNFFSVLGVRPAAGRLFVKADDQRGCMPTAVVSQGFAQREHGGADGAVGRTLSIDGHPFEIIGVTDGAFTGLDVGLPPDVYLPICAQAITTGRADILDVRARWYLNIIGRLKPGMSLDQANAHLTSIAPQVFSATLPPDWPTTQQTQYLASKLAVHPAAAGLSELREGYRRALFTLMVVVGIVLLIACANIANLLLARAASRQREIAIRLAIGVGRWRLTRQLLTESLLLSFAGATLGVVFAGWASRLLVGLLSTSRNPIWLDLTLDVRVLAFTIGLATLTGVVFGLVPAWRASHVDPQATLKSGGRSASRSGMAHRLGRALVVVQLALSLVLITAGVLLVGSFRRLVTLDAGFNREDLVLVGMNYLPTGLKGDALLAAQGSMLQRIREIPGLTSASASVITPLGSTGWNDQIQVPGFTPASRGDGLAYFNQVSDGYFTALGIGFIAGRDIAADDIAAKRSVAVISETMAKRVFGSVNGALGRTFTTPDGKTSSPPREVIGIVRDTKQRRLNEAPQALVYFPFGVGDQPWTSLTYEIRALGQSANVVAQVRALATAAHPGIALQFSTLATQVAETLARPRLLATLSGFFGLLAVLLAIIGLYGTMAYNVTQRRNEIGIRMALGAGNPRVLRMVVGEATRLIGAGVVVGTLLAFSTTRLMTTFLFGVTATDMKTMVFAAGVLTLIGLAAAFAPAWRAARLDPMTALRDE